MCEPTTIALAASVAAGGLGAYGAYQQSSYQKAAAKANAIEADRAAADAVARGEKEAQNVRRQGNLLLGSQRASLAARGLDLQSGTAQDLQDDTEFFAQSDAVTARNNGRKEAAGLRNQGAQYRAQANATSPMLNTAGSLLGSAASVADRWYTYNLRPGK